MAIDNLPGSVNNLTLNAINKFERKTSGKGAIRAGKGFTLFILNEDMNIIIINHHKSWENSGVLIDRVTETVNHEIRKQEDKFLGALSVPLTTSLVQQVISSVVKDICWGGVRRAGKGYMDKIF